MASWFDRVVTAVERAYERRLSQASGLDRHSAHAEITPPDEDEVEIVNLPRGVAVAAPTEPDSANE